MTDIAVVENLIEKLTKKLDDQVSTLGSPGLFDYERTEIKSNIKVLKGQIEVLEWVLNN